MGREQFSGPVDVRWLSEHERDMMLLADLTFTDSKVLSGQRISGI
jgi:hypothetical protein